jgi:predicted esterase
MAQEHHLTVPRTARYFTRGAPGPAVREVWMVCHGYGQLAEPFLAHFADVASPTRWIVAPEGLSRYYLGPLSGGSHAANAVGASWMTREDRAAEIADQVTYLDALHDALFTALDRRAVRLTVLGFSQGVATVCRWLSHSRVVVDRLVCWGGAIPDDISLTHGAWVGHVDVRLVAGTRDEFVGPERVEREMARLNAARLKVSRLSFDGGHRLDDNTIRALADEFSGPED